MEGWMDETFVKGVFSTVLGENVQVKVIRDRNSGYVPSGVFSLSVLNYFTDSYYFRNAGYCFVEFNTPEAAQKALGLTGTPVPNSSRVFKLNWASGGGLVDRRYVSFFNCLMFRYLLTATFQ